MQTVSLYALTTLGVVCVIVTWAIMTFRARAMRRLAEACGLTFVGPASSLLTIFRSKQPPLPIPMHKYPLCEIYGIWNLIEGSVDGVRVVVFDSAIDTRQQCTFLACETAKDPFGVRDAPGDFSNLSGLHVLQAEGWTILYRIPNFINNPFSIGTLSTGRLKRFFALIRRADRR